MARLLQDPVLGVLSETLPMTNVWGGHVRVLDGRVEVSVIATGCNTPIGELLLVLSDAVHFVELSDSHLREMIADELLGVYNTEWKGRNRSPWDQPPDLTKRQLVDDLSLKCIGVHVVDDLPYLEVTYESGGLLFGDRWPMIVLDKERKLVSVLLE